MWLSIDEACEKLKVSRNTLQRRLNPEEIKSNKEYGKRLVWCEGSNSNQSNDSEMTQSKQPEHSNESNHPPKHSNESHLNEPTDPNDTFDSVAYLKSRLEIAEKRYEDFLKELIEERERNDDERKRTDTIIMQLTQQLERTQLQLEDLRETKTLWQRVRSVFIPNSA